MSLALVCLLLGSACGSCSPAAPAEEQAPVAIDTAPAPPEPEAPAAGPRLLPLLGKPDWNNDVLLGPAFTRPVLPLSEQAIEALAERNYRRAEREVAALGPEDLSGAMAGDRAFLLAWLRIRLDRAQEAVPLLEAISRSEHAPPAYLDLTRAELLLEDGRPVEAIPLLEGIDAEETVIWPRARLVLANAYEEAGRTADARATWRELVARSDPAEGSGQALLALASRSGEDACTLLRRLWTHYPTSAEARRGAADLKACEARSRDHAATWRHRAWRADALMKAWRFQEATNLLSPVLSHIQEPDADACVAWYAYGRSHYRRNNLTLAAQVLTPAGEKCAGIDDDRGAKSLYLAGKALERKKQWADAARVYERLPVLYPEHTMADDGYTLAGIGWQESGDLDRARKSWATQVNDHPEGDMAGEGFWRLAWGAWLAGDTHEAIAWASRAPAEIPFAVDPVRIVGARYWHARWLLFPDPEAPTALTTDPEAREEGIRLLLGLVAQHPARLYTFYARARLQELAPERLAALPPAGWGGEAGPWVVRSRFLDHPATRNAVGLARLGLLTEAIRELDSFGDENLSPGEMGALVELVASAGFELWAHDRLRKYLRHVPPEFVDPENRARLLTLAYPDTWESEVRAACEDYAWDYRMFHALVREESNFNPGAVSHAGARGLSQLMPRTARSVARWMGREVSTAQLFDPELNLAIGARYMEALMKRYAQDPFLSMAGYNAGEGNVNRWLREHGNVPADAFVESIPFRETRRYVKRVAGTWQMYRLLYEPDPSPGDLTAFNRAAVPGE